MEDGSRRAAEVDEQSTVSTGRSKVDEPFFPSPKRRLPKFFSFDNPIIVLMFTIVMLTLSGGAVR